MRSITTTCHGAKRSLLLLTLVLLGCGQSEYGDMAKVTGVVTLDGAPYPNAQVRFVPAEGRPSIGMTDSSGRYELVYIAQTKGAAPGEYSVDITTVYQSTSDTDGGVAPPEALPAKYNRTTELKETVEPGENEINFELTSK